MAGSKRRGSSSSSGGSPGMFSRKGTAPASQPASAQRQMPPPTVPASLPQKLPQSSTASSMPKPVTPAPTSSASPMAPTSAPHGSAYPPRAPGAPGAYPQAPMGGMPMGGMPGQPSMMRSIISSAIGSAVGVTASHALMNAFSSGDKEQLAQISQQEQGGKCAIQFQSFLKCLENNSSNVNSCQWASDMLNQCKAENPQ